jgi:hypothetical protein
MMDTATIYAMIGYVGSILVAIGLLMTSILRLRLFSLSGAIVFIIYSVLIEAYPVVILNIVIIMINLYQLNKLRKLEDAFDLLDVDVESSYLKRFIVFHHDEIEKFYPKFLDNPLNTAEAQIVIFVLRNMLPVGLFIAKESEGGRAVVKLDYVIPGYRDFKVGQYLYRQKADFFKSQGITRLISYPGNDAHEKYLTRMGFQRDFATSDRRLYQLKL